MIDRDTIIEIVDATQELADDRGNTLERQLWYEAEVRLDEAREMMMRSAPDDWNEDLPETITAALRFIEANRLVIDGKYRPDFEAADDIPESQHMGAAHLEAWNHERDM